MWERAFQDPEVIWGSGSHVQLVDIDVQQFDLGWLSGVPLYKTGTCEVQVVATVVRAKSSALPPVSLEGTRNLTGTIDYTVTGICSLRNLKELLAEDVADSFRAWLRDSVEGAAERMTVQPGQ